MKTMPEYIEREAVEKAVLIKREQERQYWIEHLKQYRGTPIYSSKEQAVDNWLRGYGEAVENLLAIFETLPTADVEEVRHGKWEEEYPGSDNIVCPACGKLWNVLDNCTEEFDRCPNCGAKMDKKEGAEIG